MNDVLLKATGLTKVYRSEGRQKTAVDNVDLSVRRGEIHALMGLSGSGKSTLLRMLNRLIEPTSGSVELDGQPLSAMSLRELRDVRNRRIAMVFQHFALLPHVSVRGNAAYGLRVRGQARKAAYEKADEVLAVVGLEGLGDARPDQLSGGMKQRVGLARALATGADILLMDEPFSALDPLIRRDMQELVLRLAESFHTTIVCVTHDPNEAMRISDAITLLKDGRIAQTGGVADILTRPADDYVRRFVEEADRSRVLTARDVMAPVNAAEALPRARVKAEDTLAQIARSLLDVGAATVVDEEREPLGRLTYHAVLEAVSREEKAS